MTQVSVCFRTAPHICSPQPTRATPTTHAPNTHTPHVNAAHQPPRPSNPSIPLALAIAIGVCIAALLCLLALAVCLCMRRRAATKKGGKRALLPTASLSVSDQDSGNAHRPSDG